MRHDGGPRSRPHHARLYPLRFLHSHLPHLPTVRQRTRRPARAHLSDQAGGGRCDADGEDTIAPRSLPDLPRLRNHLPIRRRICQVAGYRPLTGGHAGAAPGRLALYTPPAAPGTAPPPALCRRPAPRLTSAPGHARAAGDAAQPPSAAPEAIRLARSTAIRTPQAGA